MNSNDHPRPSLGGSKAVDGCCHNQSIADPAKFVSRIHGFRLDLMQIDQGKFSAQGFQTWSGKAWLSVARLSRAHVQTWQMPARWTTTVLNISDGPAKWRGMTFGASDILVAGPNTKIELVSGAGFAVAALSFPDDEFQRAADLSRLALDGQAGATLIRHPSVPANSARATIDVLIRDHAATAGSGAPGHEVLHAIVDAAASGVWSDLPRTGARRAEAIELATAALRADPSVNVTRLCRIAGVSERSLRSTFAERYGMSPARFIKAYRLNGVRRDLSRRPSHKTIYNVATKWGFCHQGEFASEYRRWFGELPSETERHVPGNEPG
jgi:AraC family ethanolamine operon transcriptional activator